MNMQPSERELEFRRNGSVKNIMCVSIYMYIILFLRKKFKVILNIVLSKLSFDNYYREGWKVIGMK